MLARNSTLEANQQDDHLAALAHQIRDQHQQIRRTLGLTLGQMLDLGDLLITAQGLIQSNWKRWLRSECFLSVSTAQLYQQLSRNRHAIEAELSRVPDLTLRAARRLISKPKAATTVGRTATRASAIDIATVRLAETISRLLWQALGHLALEEEPKAIASLQGVLSKLRRKRLEFHDIAIVVQRQASARPRARRRST